jgi:hypothetical protein
MFRCGDSVVVRQNATFVKSLPELDLRGKTGKVVEPLCIENDSGMWLIQIDGVGLIPLFWDEFERI